MRCRASTIMTRSHHGQTQVILWQKCGRRWLREDACKDTPLQEGDMLKKCEPSGVSALPGS
jgi:hypothetical protein